MTHYDILGVSKGATQEEIRKAYIKLIKRYHPDLYYGDKKYAEKRTQEINNAYDVLSDAEAKRKYDAEIGANTTQGNTYYGAGASTRSSTQSYAQTYSSYSDSRPNYEEKERARNIYEEVLKNYRKKYNDYIDNRNNASNTYGSYQNTRRKKKKKEYSYKGYEKINELCDELNVSVSIKIGYIIIFILMISIFIVINSFTKASFFSNKSSNMHSEKQHAVVTNTKSEENKTQSSTERNNIYQAAIESEFCKLYDRYKETMDFDDADDILELIDEEDLEDIYDLYYSEQYTYERFYNHLWNVIDDYINRSK